MVCRQLLFVGNNHSSRGDKQQRDRTALALHDKPASLYGYNFYFGQTVGIFVPERYYGFQGCTCRVG